MLHMYVYVCTNPHLIIGHPHGFCSRSNSRFYVQKYVQNVHTFGVIVVSSELSSKF